MVLMALEICVVGCAVVEI